MTIHGENVGRYRHRPVTIEAMLYTGLNRSSVVRWMNPDARPTSNPGDGTIEVRTLEGTLTARPGDWIIRGVKGEFYPCKPDVFDAIYEGVHPDLSYSGEFS